MIEEATAAGIDRSNEKCFYKRVSATGANGVK